MKREERRLKKREEMEANKEVEMESLMKTEGKNITMDARVTSIDDKNVNS